ncbi:MAG: DNA-binding response OmpR family regulator [Alteromonadaceae bacterium]|jgi:DNA-binding response OmpR family regulator
MKHNALLVEDDLDLAATIIDYLELEDIVCDHAANGIAGLQLINKHHYDVIILDVNMPRMDGLSVCQNIREQGMTTPVLMLTARDTLDDKLAGFAVGSDDYLVKPFAMLELVARLKALAQRRSGQTSKLTVQSLSVDLDKKVAIRGSRKLHLSPIGWKILEILLRKSPEAVSREKIAQAVWGDDVPESNSLKVHIFKLREQVEGENEQKLIHTLPGVGFTLRELDS